MAQEQLIRVAYFTPTKRDGMFVGVCSDKNLDALIEVIRDARTQNKNLVFMLWRNEPREGRKSVATLTVTVERDRPQARRPIESTPPPAKSDPLAGLLGGGGKTARTAL